MLPKSTILTIPVTDIIPETPDTQTYRLGTYFDYKPGQAVSLMLPGDPKKRYYSLSSSPTEKGHLDVTIKADRDKALYGDLFNLKIGTQIKLEGPLGKFALPMPLAGPYFFLAAGSGVTPFRSMIKFVLDTRPATETWLFNSVRTPDDLIFKAPFLAWSENPAFHYVPTFTRTSQDDVAGETGRMGEALLRKHLKILEGIFFLCGPRGFVTDMEHVLTGLHVPAACIRRENW